MQTKHQKKKAIMGKRKNASPKGIYLIPTEPNKYYDVTSNGVHMGSASRGNPNGSFSFLKRKVVGGKSEWTGEYEVLKRDEAFAKIKKDRLRKVDHYGSESSHTTRN